MADIGGRVDFIEFSKENLVWSAPRTPNSYPEGGFCSIDSYFTEIREGVRGAALVFRVLVEVSLNLRRQPKLQTSHSLFQ